MTPTLPTNDDPSLRLARQAWANQRLRSPKSGEGVDLLLPENVAAFLRAELAPPLRSREHLGAIFFDEAAGPVAYNVPYRGYLARVRIEPRRILAPAVLVGAAGLIMFHNRPRRATVRRDVSIARSVRAGCELMGFRLLDFLILGDGDAYVSLRQERRARFHSLGDDLPDPDRDGRRSVAPKYRNPEQPHQTWSGRGRMAKWLREKVEAGARLEDFAIGD